ncbi:class I SAM-dependent methyltransferase [Streptomyces sp. ST2-7A]|uniref:class I SAM-dependent methyltransferase n=1 Tax=Streptomyces sp. ST2-7A TaxID=2907214 RepID=UPI001F298494|nr:class I SAM-dependent methyltransferase [Streptomyces sp. ST2-7A]MCE7081149.1 class I SAM-dependent methyltransferase [Streptomyces sp. ST2-7A]
MIDTAAATAWSRPTRPPGQVELSACRHLRALAATVPANRHIVELGAYRGRSTGWLLTGAQEGHGPHLTTIDPWEDRTDPYSDSSPRYTTARPHFEAHMRAIGASPDRHTVTRARAVDAARTWPHGPTVALLFHDADHTEDAVHTDLTAWLPHLAPGATIALHDAANPTMGVEAGARAALPADHGWDWENAHTLPWARRPHRRGLLTIHHRETR